MRNMHTSVFGISIKYEAWKHRDSLPVYIAGSYDFYTAYIGNRRCIMLTPIEELATLPALKKQIIKIQQIDNGQSYLNLQRYLIIEEKAL